MDTVMMRSQNHFICSILVAVLFRNVVLEKVMFINVEHPRVTYVNTDYFRYCNLTTTRHGRANPIYYVGVHFDILVPLNRDIILDFYFYELLTNVYKPSFIHIHYNWCDLLEKEVFFGTALRQGNLKKPCPHPPGKYRLDNMTISPRYVPRGFPFSNGRIYANLTQAKTKTRIGEGHIDIKLIRVDRKFAED